jgi:hypothetical protein
MCVITYQATDTVGEIADNTYSTHSQGLWIMYYIFISYLSIFGLGMFVRLQAGFFVFTNFRTLHNQLATVRMFGAYVLSDHTWSFHPPLNQINTHEKHRFIQSHNKQTITILPSICDIFALVLKPAQNSVKCVCNSRSIFNNKNSFWKQLL